MPRLRRSGIWFRVLVVQEARYLSVARKNRASTIANHDFRLSKSHRPVTTRPADIQKPSGRAEGATDQFATQSIMRVTVRPFRSDIGKRDGARAASVAHTRHPSPPGAPLIRRAIFGAGHSDPGIAASGSSARTRRTSKRLAVSLYATRTLCRYSGKVAFADAAFRPGRCRIKPH
jgi:hypothetical protein